MKYILLAISRPEDAETEKGRVYTSLVSELSKTSTTSKESQKLDENVFLFDRENDYESFAKMLSSVLRFRVSHTVKFLQSD